MWFQTDGVSSWNVGSRNDGTTGGGFSFESNSPSWSSKLFIATARTVRFGTVSGSGLGVQLWREIRGSTEYEKEEP